MCFSRLPPWPPFGDSDSRTKNYTPFHSHDSVERTAGLNALLLAAACCCLLLLDAAAANHLGLGSTSRVRRTYTQASKQSSCSLWGKGNSLPPLSHSSLLFFPPPVPKSTESPVKESPSSSHDTLDPRSLFRGRCASHSHHVRTAPLFATTVQSTATKFACFASVLDRPGQRRSHAYPCLCLCQYHKIRPPLILHPLPSVPKTIPTANMTVLSVVSRLFALGYLGLVAASPGHLDTRTEPISFLQGTYK